MLHIFCNLKIKNTDVPPVKTQAAKKVACAGAKVGLLTGFGTPVAAANNFIVARLFYVSKIYNFSPTATTISQGPIKPLSDSNF